MGIGNIYNNSVYVNGGTINGVTGGLTIYYPDMIVGNVYVYNNTVEINGGTIGYVSGGEIGYGYLSDEDIPTDFSNALGKVHGNKVLIKGGEITGGVVGGSALGGDAYKNTVKISGGKISGDVIGGLTQSGTSHDNEITISGNPDLSGANLWGGRIGDSTPFYNGNTLNIESWGITAQNIYGFDTINFTLPNKTADVALTLTDGSTYFGGTENINVATRGDSNIGTGSTLNLIHNENGIDTNGKSYSSKLSRGVTFDYDMDIALSTDGKTLQGTVKKIGPLNEETKVVPEGPIANVVPVNIGTDNMIKSFDDFLGNNIAEDMDGFFIDSISVKKIENESYSDRAQKAEDVQETKGFEIFASINYGHLKTKTGNGYVKTESNNFDLGLARTYEGNTGKWVIAPVVEHGKGNYDALLSNGIKGYGDTKYTAGGFIGRRVNDNGYYFEASARLGRAKNDFASDDFIVNDQPTRATYNTSATIFAGHVRVGQARRLNKSNLLDVYGIYAYTRQGGSNATLSTGEDYNFSSVNSSRLRLGYRLTTRTSRISRIYTGLAYQYEHTSDALTKTFDAEGNSWTLPSSGSKGSSGMLEIGWLIRPRKENPWFVDINATGWVGHQKGATAMAKVKKAF